MTLTLFFLLNLISSLVFTVNNPVYAAFWLIITFVCSAVFIWILNSNFFALVYIIIYVGAIAVLFLFVIMMLEIKIINIKRFYDFKNLGEIFLFLILSFFPFILSFWFSKNIITDNVLIFEEDFSIAFDLNLDLHALGQILFNNYTFCILIGGLILLVAILGAVILTLNISNKQVKLSSKQLSRSENFLSFFK